MKKVLILTVILSVSFKGFCQDAFSDLKPKVGEKILNSDTLFKKFMEMSPIFVAHPELKLSKNIEKISLVTPNLIGFQLPIENSSTYNYVVGYYNSDKNDYFSYYELQTKLNGTYTTEIFDEAGNYLYTTSADGHNFNIILPGKETGKTPFSDCMHVMEAYYEDTISGWLLWNVVAVTQINAAVYCQGCVKGWWHLSCPPKAP